MKSRVAFDLDIAQATHPIFALRLSVAVETDPFTRGVPRWRGKAHVAAEGYGFMMGVYALHVHNEIIGSGRAPLVDDGELEAEGGDGSAALMVLRVWGWGFRDGVKM